MVFNEMIRPYSLVWLAGGVLIVTGFLLFRNKPRAPARIAFGVILIALVAVWVAIHPRQTPLLGEAAQLQAMIGNGKPVLLEFQSPF
jgi:hypothetical protein